MSFLGIGADTPQQKKNKLRGYANEISNGHTLVRQFYGEIDGIAHSIGRFVSPYGNDLANRLNGLCDSAEAGYINGAVEYVNQEVYALNHDIEREAKTCH
ncbi:MAG: hypothetical protein LBK67_06775 [Coriobacteriales bacterium]|jgi:hypothetical protein|nr:hypothetical protein [Coriobacteriales bacterium]